MGSWERGHADGFRHDRQRFRAEAVGPHADDPFACHLETVDLVEPLDAVLRSSGQYGARIDVPPDADQQTRLIAFTGRQP